MITWATLRAQTRRSVLNDAIVAGRDEKWSNTQLLDAVKWALDEFCAHTAVATATSFTMDGSDSSVSLPDNVYLSPEEAGVVLLTENDKRAYLKPYLRVPGDVFSEDALTADTEPRMFWEQPSGTLHFGFVPSSGSTIEIQYFAYYNHPINDESEIAIPRWAEYPVALLIGCSAITEASAQTSNIRQYGVRPDTGNPEHNPLHRHAEFLMQTYERLVGRVTPQRRPKGSSWQ